MPSTSVSHAHVLLFREPSGQCLRVPRWNKASLDRATDRVNQVARLTVGPAPWCAFSSRALETQPIQSTHLKTIASEVVQGRAPAPEDVRPRREAFPPVCSAENCRLAAGFCPPCRLRKNIVAHSSKRDMPVLKVARFAQSNEEEGETRPEATGSRSGRSLCTLCSLRT